MNVLNQ